MTRRSYALNSFFFSVVSETSDVFMFTKQSWYFMFKKANEADRDLLSIEQRL